MEPPGDPPYYKRKRKPASTVKSLSANLKNHLSPEEAGSAATKYEEEKRLAKMGRDNYRRLASILTKHNDHTTKMANIVAEKQDAQEELLRSVNLSINRGPSLLGIRPNDEIGRHMLLMEFSQQKGDLGVNWIGGAQDTLNAWHLGELQNNPAVRQYFATVKQMLHWYACNHTDFFYCLVDI